MPTSFPSYVILFVYLQFEKVAQRLKLLGFSLPSIYLLTYIPTYLLAYLLTYLITYLLTYLLHGAESFLSS